MIFSFVATPVTEDYCGVEPVTHPPNIHETRPLEHLDQNKVARAYNRANSAILGGMCSRDLQLRRITLRIFFYGFVWIRMSAK